MPAWPDAPRIHEFLGQARRRLAAFAVLRGASIGFLISIVVILIVWRLGWRPVAGIGIALSLATAAAFVALRRGAIARADTGLEIERPAPQCRNLVVTAAGIRSAPDRVRDYIGARVCRDAAKEIDRLSLAQLFPSRRPLAVFAGAILACAGALVLL